MLLSESRLKLGCLVPKANLINCFEKKVLSLGLHQSSTHKKIQFTILLCHTTLPHMLWPPISFLIKYFKLEFQYRHNYNPKLCTTTQRCQILKFHHICFRSFLKLNIIDINRFCHEFPPNSKKMTTLLNVPTCFSASYTCLHP